MLPTTYCALRMLEHVISFVLTKVVFIKTVIYAWQAVQESFCDLYFIEIKIQYFLLSFTGIFWFSDRKKN